MKLLKSIAAFTFLIYLFSFKVDNSFTTPTQLGEKIFNAIKAQNKNEILDLIVKKKEILSTIDKSGMPQDKAEELRKSFVNKWESQQKETREKIIKGYNKIINDIIQRNCQKTIRMGVIIPETLKLRNLPIELAHLDIEYKCGEPSDTIGVDIINTSEGWRILEHLR